MDASFEWNPVKDEENQRKHGVSFVLAQQAFIDPQRVIAKDLQHSKTEQRFYCFGRIPEGIVTVRLTYRNGLSASSARASGVGARKFMKRKTTYRNEPLGKLEVVRDFLPPPDQLVLKDEGVKVTLSLSKRSVEFFKRHAQKSKVPYQKMIRTLLDSYAEVHRGK